MKAVRLAFFFGRFLLSFHCVYVREYVRMGTVLIKARKGGGSSAQERTQNIFKRKVKNQNISLVILDPYQVNLTGV